MSSALTGLCARHQISLGQDDRDCVLLHRRRLLVLAQHYVVLDDVSKINVRKLSRQTNVVSVSALKTPTSRQPAHVVTL